MKCPECGNIGSSVDNTYLPVKYKFRVIKRFRRCSSCGAKFTTIERFVERRSENETSRKTTNSR